MEQPDTSIQQQGRRSEVVEEIIIKTEIKRRGHNNAAQDVQEKEIKSEGTWGKRFNIFSRKSWPNDRHVEADEIDDMFIGESKSTKSEKSESFLKKLRRGLKVSRKKEKKPEVDEADAIFEREFQSSISKKSKPKRTGSNKRVVRNGSTVNMKKSQQPDGLSHDAMKSLLGGGGYVLG